MLAIDTNILVRFLTGDDPDQAERPATLMRESDILISTAGLDFADALHLAASADCEAFVTFDPRLATAAESLQVPIIRLG